MADLRLTFVCEGSEGIELLVVNDFVVVAPSSDKDSLERVILVFVGVGLEELVSIEVLISEVDGVSLRVDALKTTL